MSETFGFADLVKLYCPDKSPKTKKLKKPCLEKSSSKTPKTQKSSTTKSTKKPLKTKRVTLDSISPDIEKIAISTRSVILAKYRSDFMEMDTQYLKYVESSYEQHLSELENRLKRHRASMKRHEEHRRAVQVGLEKKQRQLEEEAFPECTISESFDELESQYQTQLQNISLATKSKVKFTLNKLWVLNHQLNYKYSEKMRVLHNAWTAKVRKSTPESRLRAFSTQFGRLVKINPTKAQELLILVEEVELFLGEYDASKFEAYHNVLSKFEEEEEEPEGEKDEKEEEQTTKKSRIEETQEIGDDVDVDFEEEE